MYKNLSLIYREIGLPKEQILFYNSKVQSARIWGRITSKKHELAGRVINLYLKDEVEQIVKEIPFGTILKRGAKLKNKEQKEPKVKKEKVKKEPFYWYKKVSLNIPLKVLSKINEIERLENVLNKLIPLRYTQTKFTETDKTLPSRREIIKVSKANFEKLKEVCEYDKQIKNLLRNILINYANKN